MADGSLSTTARPKRLTARQQRQTMEQAIDRLLDALQGALAALDQLDGDADFEPSLAFPEALTNGWRPAAHLWPAAVGSDDEREEVSEDEGAVG